MPKKMPIAAAISFECPDTNKEVIVLARDIFVRNETHDVGVYIPCPACKGNHKIADRSLRMKVSIEEDKHENMGSSV
jgi:hypothetical protein